MSKQIHVNAFTQCCVGPQSAGQWKNPEDRSSHGYRDPAFWVDIAKTLERGCLDSLFFADIHGVYDVYGGDRHAGIRHAIQVPGNDPTPLFPLMAMETEHLGFIATYSTTYFQPYLTAKHFSSLDHFTRGRTGWNIVTSYLNSAARNGLGHMLEHDQRYDVADEYMSVVYQLWESSWEDGAVVRDVGNDVHTDPTRVHLIEHHGAHFEVEGPHMCEPSPQRTPLLVQAGQSPRGIQFCAAHAEAQFVVFQSKSAAAAGVRRTREAAEALGRRPDGIKFLQALAVIVDETEDAAKRKHVRYLEHGSAEGALVLFGGWTGVDLSGFAPSDALDAFESQGMQHLASFFKSVDDDAQWTLAKMSEYMKLASVCPVVVGSPAQIADEMERWIDEGGIDGFNLMPVVQPGSFEDFVDLVVPELQRRGRMRRSYAGSTLRENFFGEGQRRLRSDHPGWRMAAAGECVVKDAVV